MRFLRNIFYHIRYWKVYFACKRDLSFEIKPDDLRKDLNLVIELLDASDQADEDQLPFKATNLYTEAIHLLKSIPGTRVWPPMYGQYNSNFKLRHHIFGYRAPSSPENAGLRPTVRTPQ